MNVTGYVLMHFLQRNLDVDNEIMSRQMSIRLLGFIMKYVNVWDEGQMKDRC